MADRSIPGIALWLGYASVVPFVVCSLGLVTLPPKLHGVVLYSLLTYAAVALTFQGAVHWGLALRNGISPPPVQLGLSMLPLLAGWGALALPPNWAFLVLIVGFVLVALADVLAARYESAPSWYPRLRVPMSLLTVASLCVSAFLL